MEVSWHVKEFLTYLAETDRAPRTIEAYRGRLRDLARLFGARSVTTITSAELVQIVGSDDAGQDYTRAMRIQAIKTFFQFCTNRGYIPLSPARTLVRPSRRKPRPDRPGDLYLASDQLESSLSAMPAGNLYELIEEYISFKLANGRSQKTIKIDREKLRELCDFFVGRKVQEITPRMMDLYIASLRARLAPATVGMCITRSKIFFKFLVDRNYLDRSPAAHLVKPKVTHIRNEKVMDQADLERLIDYTRSEGMTFLHCVLLLLADSGCRIGELLNLNLCDIDLEHCEASVCGKTGPRIIDFTAPTRTAIQAWLVVRPVTDPLAVFTTREGRASHACVYHALQQAADQLGIERFNPHAIRHRVGQAWTDSGASLELVRIKLGHADVTTTAKFYTHQDRERAKAASGKFSIVGGLS